MKNRYVALLLATALAAAAAEAPKQPADFKGAATMCKSTYALCIKAPCDKAKESNGYAPCECVIQTGWNLGPNTCDERKQNLTSTYSNNFNDGSRTVSCPLQTDWAWCYGAACERNSKHPNELATCKCPILNKPTVILTAAAKCPQADQICSHLWSGALPAESTFANQYYYWWMTEHHLPSQKPADACTPTAGHQ